MTTTILTVTVIVLCYLGSTHCFPDGAPSIACTNMVPGHLPSHPDGQNPFVLTLSASSYKPGDNITGVLSASDSRKFKGFLIQVSKTVDNVQPVGKFINLDSTRMKTVCDQDGNGGITHTDNKEKTRLAFTWQAPPEAEGTLYFRATAVEYFGLLEGSRFWLNINSQIEPTE